MKSYKMNKKVYTRITCTCFLFYFITFYRIGFYCHIYYAHPIDLTCVVFILFNIFKENNIHFTYQLV